MVGVMVAIPPEKGMAAEVLIFALSPRLLAIVEVFLEKPSRRSRTSDKDDRKF
jgi:hypothetical protein